MPRHSACVLTVIVSSGLRRMPRSQQRRHRYFRSRRRQVSWVVQRDDGTSHLNWPGRCYGLRSGRRGKPTSWQASDNSSRRPGNRRAVTNGPFWPDADDLLLVICALGRTSRLHQLATAVTSELSTDLSHSNERCGQPWHHIGGAQRRGNRGSGKLQRANKDAGCSRRVRRLAAARPDGGTCRSARLAV